MNKTTRSSRRFKEPEAVNLTTHELVERGTEFRKFLFDSYDVPALLTFDFWDTSVADFSPERNKRLLKKAFKKTYLGMESSKYCCRYYGSQLLFDRLIKVSENIGGRIHVNSGWAPSVYADEPVRIYGVQNFEIFLSSDNGPQTNLWNLSSALGYYFTHSSENNLPFSTDFYLKKDSGSQISAFLIGFLTPPELFLERAEVYRDKKGEIEYGGLGEEFGLWSGITRDYHNWVEKTRNELISQSSQSS
ncbi:MAG TPA: hypothetical protein VJZ93_01225 [Candidatus Nanoarchaeia archaeon]|nr:hypothetical protein [Candidatus Nanoarchaeia archaeon]